jgi:hypothetical protein
MLRKTRTCSDDTSTQGAGVYGSVGRRWRRGCVGRTFALLTSARPRPRRGSFLRGSCTCCGNCWLDPPCVCVTGGAPSNLEALNTIRKSGSSSDEPEPDSDGRGAAGPLPRPAGVPRGTRVRCDDPSCTERTVAFSLEAALLLPALRVDILLVPSTGVRGDPAAGT